MMLKSLALIGPGRRSVLAAVRQLDPRRGADTAASAVYDLGHYHQWTNHSLIAFVAAQLDYALMGSGRYARP